MTYTASFVSGFYGKLVYPELIFIVKEEAVEID